VTPGYPRRGEREGAAMKKPGFRRTRRGIKGHQRCRVCHPALKNGRKRQRRTDRCFRECREEMAEAARSVGKDSA
jgi:hypothetical protein